MPILPRPASAAVVACLALVLLVGLAPGRANALEPPRPLPGHRPVFVTETDTRPWVDCLWASASMLLDKWSNGDVRISHGRLRRLSGDLHGGSSLEDLQVALRRLGYRIALDANGHSTLTWGGLLSRLRRGAGAVVMGDYGDLPRWYGRWDARFWRSKGKKKNDDHAMYVERYDARRGRVWVMDPLGRGDYHGEWMSIGNLYRFAWFSGGRVQAVTTPTAKAAPYKGVRVGAVRFERSASAVTAVWPLEAPRRWRFPGADARVSISPAGDALAAAAMTAAAAVTAGAAAAPARPVVRWSGQALRVSTALPERPGAYLVALGATDRRFGRRVAGSGPVAAFVPGPRRATVYLHSAAPAQPAGGNLPAWPEGNEGGTPSRAAPQQPAGGSMPVWITVTNSGSATWVDAAKRSPERREPPRATRAVATWIRLDADAPGAGDGGRASVAAGDARLTTVLGELALAAGGSATITADIPVPGTAGRWVLVIDIVDDLDGSFAALGSRPAVGLYEVVGPSIAGPAKLSAE
jgi:hypothetical protein